MVGLKAKRTDTKGDKELVGTMRRGTVDGVEEIIVGESLIGAREMDGR